MYAEIQLLGQNSVPSDFPKLPGMQPLPFKGVSIQFFQGIPIFFKHLKSVFFLV